MVQHGNVDFVRDARDLSIFKDGEIEEIYASHILEHFPHTETTKVLKEWRRVLKTGAKAYISVPDLLNGLEFVKREPATDWPIHLIYGNQTHPLAFHYVNFTYPFLARKLSEAGFSDVKRIENMPYGLNDASQTVDNHYGIPISLNVEATA